MPGGDELGDRAALLEEELADLLSESRESDPGPRASNSPTAGRTKRTRSASSATPSDRTRTRPTRGRTAGRTAARRGSRTTASPPTTPRAGTHSGTARSGTPRPGTCASGSNVQKSITDCYWYDAYDGSSGSPVADIYGAAVTADGDWHLRGESRTDIEVESGGSLTIAGESVGTVTRTAAESGLEDPRPLPAFHFGDGENGDGGGGKDGSAP